MSLLVSLLFGCAVPNAPEKTSLIAPDSVVRLKERYQPLPNTSNAPSAEVSSDAQEAGNYVLGPGDQLTVVIQRVPNASYDIAVRPDGYISLPVVDEVEAAGLTPAQLDSRLTALYAKRLVDPDLSVIVRACRVPMVYVLGKVAKPGPIPYSEAASAAEAIARAGDMLPTADQGNVTIIRLGKDGTIRPLAALASLGQSDALYQAAPYMVLAATQLEPEDLLFVPERGVARLGTNMEQLLKPLTTTGSAAGSVLSPWLMWKLLDEINSANGSVDVNP